MLILGIETSCDETACAVVADGKQVLSNVVASQVKIHSPYGGVVPELASRAHISNIVPVMDEAVKEAGVKLSEITAIAVTIGPGLIGSLLVGLEFAKALSFAMDKPLIGVHHLAAHLYSIFLDEDSLEYPYLGLVVSGGHTSIIIADSPVKYREVGQTLDDAAGEAYDKVAKLLQLGYPGGPIIDKLAKDGNPHRIDFPRPHLTSGDFNFSFSGLKTAVVHYVQEQGLEKIKLDPCWLSDLCASFQQAVIDSLLVKTEQAARHFALRRLGITGGVAANRQLRQEALNRFAGWQLRIPPLKYCTDNAAMVAAIGYHLFLAKKIIPLSTNAYSRIKIDQLIPSD